MKTMRSQTKCIGILTSGGDCPGLNAAIRGVAKSAMTDYGMNVIGIYDGFRGLVENRYVKLDNAWWRLRRRCARRRLWAMRRASCRQDR